MSSSFNLTDLLNVEVTREFAQAITGNGQEMKATSSRKEQQKENLLLPVFQKLHSSPFANILRSCKEIHRTAEIHRENIHICIDRPKRAQDSSTPPEIQTLTFEIFITSSSESYVMLRIVVANVEFCFILSDFVENLSVTLAADLSFFSFQTIHLKTENPAHEQINYHAAVDLLLEFLLKYSFTCGNFKAPNNDWFNSELNSKALRVFNPRNVLLNLIEVELPLSSLVKPEDLQLTRMLEAELPFQGNNLTNFDYAIDILLPSCRNLYLKMDKAPTQSFGFVERINRALQMHAQQNSSFNQQLHIRFENAQWNSNLSAFFHGLTYDIFTFVFPALTVAVVTIPNSEARLAVLIRTPERSNPLQQTDLMRRLFHVEAEAVAELSPFYYFHWQRVLDLNDLVTFIFRCGTGDKAMDQIGVEMNGRVIEHFLISNIVTFASIKDKFYPSKPQPVYDDEW